MRDIKKLLCAKLNVVRNRRQVRDQRGTLKGRMKLTIHSVSQTKRGVVNTILYSPRNIIKSVTWYCVGDRKNHAEIESSKARGNHRGAFNAESYTYDGEHMLSSFMG